MEPAATVGVPPLFAILNVLKSDYLAARFVAYRALVGRLPESGWYADTLDYAVYGMSPSLLCLAQRACIDIFDKIAVGTNDYFALSDSSKSVSFVNLWFESAGKGAPLRWSPALRRQIDAGNFAIIALGELALDIQGQGALQRKKSYRHAGTHRFTVLHDIGCSPSRESECVEHYPLENFEIEVIESLQLARAAILYFVEMISLGEHAKESTNDGLAVLLRTPSHHSIRGKK